LRKRDRRFTRKGTANTRTGLASPDVFAFGNLIGDADGSGRVNSLDVGAVKALLNTTAPRTGAAAQAADHALNAPHIRLRRYQESIKKRRRPRVPGAEVALRFGLRLRVHSHFCGEVDTFSGFTSVCPQGKHSPLGEEGLW
jgi:hypothetical protein